MFGCMVRYIQPNDISNALIEVSLDDGGCVYKGILEHEFKHKVNTDPLHIEFGWNLPEIKSILELTIPLYT